MLAKCRREPRSLTVADPDALTSDAISIAKSKSPENFAERWGACHFLCVSVEVSASRHSRFLRYQAPLLQSLLALSLIHI